MRPEMSGERGQMLIFAVFMITVVFIVGAIAVDIGLWLSERRGSQTDADLLALTGAWELLDPAATATDVDNAVDDALARNDEQANLTLAQPIQVDFQDRCVTVDVDHDSAPLFFSIFGLGEPSIGAHAKACAGPVAGGGNLLPFQTDDDAAPCFNNEVPAFGALCPLEMGAQGDNPRGMLDLYAPDGYCSDSQGPTNIEDMIEFGAPGPCNINTSGSCPGSMWVDCAETQTGNTQGVLDALYRRLIRDGGCDALYGNNDGTDDFDEIVVLFAPDPNDPVQNIYAPRDCDAVTDGLQISPRLVTIIVFDEYPSSNNTPYPIKGLAGYYLAGCAGENQTVNSVNDLNRDCEGNYSMVPGVPDDLFVLAPGFGPLPRPNACHTGTPHGGGPGTATPCPSPTDTPVPTPTPDPTPTPTPEVGPVGHAVVWGILAKYVIAGGAGGSGGPNDSSGLLGIYLTE